MEAREKVEQKKLAFFVVSFVSSHFEQELLLFEKWDSLVA